MAKIDKIKEILTSLRVGLSIISAFIITLGGVLGNLYSQNSISLLFWITFVFIFIFVFTGYVIIHKIRVKTDELEDL
jgi:ABC-type bacteriocin/lantibiotic exporter with double-glycine peptidase domain